MVRGRDPLPRSLYLYINRTPGNNATAPVEAFLRLVLSDRGQVIVDEQGFISLPAGVRE